MVIKDVVKASQTLGWFPLVLCYAFYLMDLTNMKSSWPQGDEWEERGMIVTGRKDVAKGELRVTEGQTI